MFSKLIDFIVDRLERRTRFPFLLPLGVSLVAWNWASVLILFFSEKTIELKILFIQENTSVWTLSFFPLLSTTSYLILMPLGVRYAAKWRLIWNKEIELDRLNHLNTVLQREIETVADKRNKLNIIHENMITSVQKQRSE